VTSAGDDISSKASSTATDSALTSTSGGADDGVVMVGKVHGAFGVRGWLRVESFTEVELDILDYQPWFIDGREYHVAEGKPHGRGLVVRLDEIDDRDYAEALHGKDIAVPSSQLPAAEPGEYYWRDLLGLKVVTVEGAELGVIESMMETGSNDVMVVKGERERLLPWIDSTVVNVDLKARVVTVQWDPEF